MKRKNYKTMHKKRAIETLLDLWYTESKRELERSRRLTMFSNLNAVPASVKKMLGKLLDKNTILTDIHKEYALVGAFGNEGIDYPYQFALGQNYIEIIDNLARLYGRSKR
jgi:hypothetical protein